MTNITVDMTNLTDQEREQLTGLLAKAKEPSIMKCTGGEWYLSTMAEPSLANSTEAYREKGLEYIGLQDAHRAAKMRTQREILNNIIRQENKRTGFVADWNDDYNLKAEIYWCNIDDNYECTTLVTSQSIGLEYCNEQSAKIIVAALNTGRIQGMDVLS